MLKQFDGRYSESLSVVDYPILMTCDFCSKPFHFIMTVTKREKLSCTSQNGFDRMLRDKFLIAKAELREALVTHLTTECEE